jgi:glycosyltransferase involved in cell wall biosynthesis
MKILVLHSRYGSGAASGENRVVEDEVRLLREGGYNVEVHAPSAEAVRRPQAALSAIWSRNALRDLSCAVRRFAPDVVHCHNLFPMLSPAVLRAAAGDAAVVMTLHNFRLMCLPATFLRDGRVCEDCRGRIPWRGVVRRCYRDSLAGSGTLAVSITAHRMFRTFDYVDRFLAVSAFVREKYISSGFAGGRISVKPNFAWPTERRIGEREGYLYAGRLSREKGLAALMDAWHAVDAPLLVAGDGPEAGDLRRRAPRNVRFLGAVDAEVAKGLMAQARAVLLPSICYEGAPRALVEAYAAGTPVVATRIGALAELVQHGRTGFLVAQGEPHGWADAVMRLDDPAEANRLGERAFHTWRERYSPERALRDLEGAYVAAWGAARERLAGRGGRPALQRRAAYKE